MPPPSAAVEHYRAQARLAAATQILAAAEWAKVGDDLEAGFSAIYARLVVILSAAQLGAARAGAAYVPAVLDEIGQSFAPVAELDPSAWMGVASDGRTLDALLLSPLVRARTVLAAGLPLPTALQSGADSLARIVQTQVADASRGASGVAITTRKGVGYTRMVSPPCCQRCAVLAGKFFKWNAGFKRHFRCDCTHIPCGEKRHEGYTSDITPDQIHDLTADQRRAITDGADVNQVINSHRRAASDLLTTTEGATRRGVYGGYVRGSDGTLTRRAKGDKAPPRLTPEGVYRLAKSRDEALELLRKYGYLL